MLNIINPDTKYFQYLSTTRFYYCATFLRLRRECHIRNLLETRRNLEQFLSTSDAIWLDSDQFKVFTYLGGGPLLTVLGVFSTGQTIRKTWSTYTNTWSTLVNKVVQQRQTRVYTSLNTSVNIVKHVKHRQTYVLHIHTTCNKHQTQLLNMV
jgi:hypothetical protein